MTDSNSTAEEPKKRLLKIINQTLKEYFDVRRERAELKLKHERKQSKIAAKYHKQDEPLAAREAELSAKLREQIIPNELMLLGGKLRSFATTFGKVSFKKKAETTKIADPAGFKRTAKWDGTLTTLGSFTRTWKPASIKDILTWMKANPKRAKKYQRFLETGGGFDELFVKPNDPYLTEHDPNRLTVESVNLGPVPDKQDEPSPDA